MVGIALILDPTLKGDFLRSGLLIMDKRLDSLCWGQLSIIISIL